MYNNPGDNSCGIGVFSVLFSTYYIFGILYNMLHYYRCLWVYRVYFQKKEISDLLGSELLEEFTPYFELQKSSQKCNLTHSCNCQITKMAIITEKLQKLQFFVIAFSRSRSVLSTL